MVAQGLDGILRAEVKARCRILGADRVSVDAKSVGARGDAAVGLESREAFP